MGCSNPAAQHLYEPVPQFLVDGRGTRPEAFLRLGLGGEERCGATLQAVPIC
jgi:hypothetical protein